MKTEYAYPSSGQHPLTENKGMPIRDYFAAKALSACYAEFFAGHREGDYGVLEGWRHGIAKDAYAMADAMIEERNQ